MRKTTKSSLLIFSVYMLGCGGPAFEMTSLATSEGPGTNDAQTEIATDRIDSGPQDIPDIGSGLGPDAGRDGADTRDGSGYDIDSGAIDSGSIDGNVESSTTQPASIACDTPDHEKACPRGTFCYTVDQQCGCAVVGYGCAAF